MDATIRQMDTGENYYPYLTAYSSIISMTNTEVKLLELASLDHLC